MPTLSSELRSAFEKEVVRAREIAEGAARAVLTTLAVEQDRPYESMSEAQRELRRSLRARARQLGEGDMTAGMPLLVEEIAYEQWHRMLFAHFLAENELLMHPEGVAVTLEECAELAQEEGAEDLWAVATRYASRMLPGIFRVDDPALQVRFAPEGRRKLEQIVSDLPKPVFTSDDGLGWAYQFWQTRKKKEVNDSGRKIEGADIAPVTQIFTEDYMVKFLLQNTMGAWWAHRHPNSPLNSTFEYLRYSDDGPPAAGTFDGWPDTVAEVTMMDPCGGSGHIVVAAFEMITRMRMEEEGLDAGDAIDATIRDNIHMLEIDLRCTQIAAFNLVLAAWKNGGYRELPTPNIACSGIPVTGQLGDWLNFARDDVRLRNALERLHELFQQAPTLGSLIDPTTVPNRDRLFSADNDEVAPLLEQALHHERLLDDSAAAFLGNIARDVFLAARLLADQYTIIVTNVPYLGNESHGEELTNFGNMYHENAAGDLATMMLERSFGFLRPGGCVSVVLPQNWWVGRSYQSFRKQMILERTWLSAVVLGEEAWETFANRGPKAVLCCFSEPVPSEDSYFWGLDLASQPNKPIVPRELKIAALQKEQSVPSYPTLGKGILVRQRDQLNNPLYRISLFPMKAGALLSEYVISGEGSSTGDAKRYIRYFWEIRWGGEWLSYISPDGNSRPWGGREQVMLWENGNGSLAKSTQARIQNTNLWNTKGVLVGRVRGISTTLFDGGSFSKGGVLICPGPGLELGTLYSFLQSKDYEDLVRALDSRVSAATSALTSVNFDPDQQFNEKIPPKISLNPTQSIFHGYPVGSEEPLQVATICLLGYQWPAEIDNSMVLSSEVNELKALGSKLLHPIIDYDGIVCLPSVDREQAAHERLRALLAMLYGAEWSMDIQRNLLSAVDFKDRSLEIWLRDGFFKQHCRLFKNRPFIWHIWDGRKDGFSALVNYHKLSHARLERLIYTYLGDWINTQRAEQEQGVAGADGRLVAALALKKNLELILEGEPPYDIYVRWKPLHKQPIGWNPDLNDGVRLNIRPFVRAGVLRNSFTISWNKDLGKNLDGSERLNDLHFTRAEKEDTRRIAGVF